MKKTNTATALQLSNPPLIRTYSPGGDTYKKGRQLVQETEKEKIVNLIKGFGDANYGPVIEIDPTIIEQHPVNLKFFDEGSKENYNILKTDIENRGIQQAIGVIRIKNVVYALDGHRRAQIACQLGIKKVKVRFARNSMTDKQQEYHVIQANIMGRDLTPQGKLDLIFKAFPDIERQVKRKLTKAAQEGNHTKPSRGDVSAQDLIDKGIATTKKEAAILLTAITNKVRRQSRGAKLLTLGKAAPNEPVLQKFYTAINNTIDKYMVGQNHKTISVAQKYLAKKSKNIFAKTKV
jgi:ParB-like chromosome segregation protein Spo0J